MSPCPHELALGHLLLRLRPLHRALRAAIALRDARAQRLRDAGASPSAITRSHADALLDDLDDPFEHRSISAGPAALIEPEVAVEQSLRERAAAAGARLPLDAMGESLGLDDFEREVLVLCAAVELDGDYERVLGFVHDDVARRVVSVELACALTVGSLRERVARRASLCPHGRLRRLGLVSVTPRETGLRDELRLTPACTDALLGSSTDLALVFRDPAEVSLVAPATVSADEDLIARAAASLRAGKPDVIAIWGPPCAAREVIAALVARTGAPVRCYPAADTEPAAAAAAAAALGALLWIDLDACADRANDTLVEICRRTRARLIFSGTYPWRPSELIAARGLVELPVTPLDHAARRALWAAHLPEVDGPALDAISTSYRFDDTEVRAAARMARATAALRTNGHTVTAAECLRDACSAVARKEGARHTSLVVPRRGPDDLVLPLDLHARVMDLAHYFRAMPRVMEEWGFSRRVSGGGVKALFTGDSGTGKTLAAEVVASELGLPLLRVDLARVVSKWIGETEKNLDVAFHEAQNSHAVLFFDEAEALFGARGEVRHGTDRYANLEVSYLLQRLEEHAGVVILATNLRDKIDPAFMRRFHLVLGFPRPGEPERRRMWQRVFTPAIPLAPDLDLSTLSRLDLTGAGIVGAAQTAALLAVREESPLGMSHVVRGLVRQFQREARVLTAQDLGVHAVHMLPK
ncbi:MAG TPA: ATP-binding protein [Kofleriaceae bacterium]|nr:ATP-binding protein [Kofleriaceae bacterium]